MGRLDVDAVGAVHHRREFVGMEQLVVVGARARQDRGEIGAREFDVARVCVRR